MFSLQSANYLHPKIGMTAYPKHMKKTTYHNVKDEQPCKLTLYLESSIVTAIAKGPVKENSKHTTAFWWTSVFK